MENWSSEPDKLALIMTDQNGVVLFANRGILSIIQRASLSDLVGQALHDVLGISPQDTENLIREIRRMKRTSNQEMVVHGDGGIPKSVLFSGTASFDAADNFLGTDIRLRKLHTVLEEKDDTLQMVNYDVHSHANAAKYFDAQYAALRSLLQDIGGKLVADRLDAIINETADRNGWMFSTDDQFSESNPIDPGVYFGLLGRAMNYGINVIGSSMVIQRFRAVDEGLPDNVRQVAMRSGFYQLFEG